MASFDVFSDRGSGPQGLRRPRFSFFRFTCQTARNQAVPLPGHPKSRRSLSLRSSLGGPIPQLVRSFKGAPSRRKRAARRMDALIWASPYGCQPPNQGIRPPAHPRNRSVQATFYKFAPQSHRAPAPHLSHIPRSFFSGSWECPGELRQASQPARAVRPFRSLTGGPAARHRATARLDHPSQG